MKNKAAEDMQQYAKIMRKNEISTTTKKKANCEVRKQQQAQHVSKKKTTEKKEKSIKIITKKTRLKGFSP